MCKEHHNPSKLLKALSHINVLLNQIKVHGLSNDVYFGSAEMINLGARMKDGGCAFVIAGHFNLSCLLSNLIDAICEITNVSATRG